MSGRPKRSPPTISPTKTSSVAECRKWPKDLLPCIPVRFFGKNSCCRSGYDIQIAKRQIGKDLAKIEPIGARAA